MNEKLTLIIGNKNYSSWSLRPWLLLKQSKIPFEEILVPLYQDGYKVKLLKYSPHGKVPALIHGQLTIWESLAICEYIAELFPEKNLWPQKREDRARARSLAAEMHSGFAQLRTHMPMNLRGSHPGKGRTSEVNADILRILDIWEGCLKESSGPFLFGHFTVADAMFAPVVTRFRTYGVVLKGLTVGYAQTMLDLPSFKEWEKAGLKEPWTVKASEIYSN
jgi:glutathione S-transferase